MFFAVMYYMNLAKSIASEKIFSKNIKTIFHF